MAARSGFPLARERLVRFYGAFYRYGYGIEGKLANADLYANRYEPLTDAKQQADGGVAYYDFHPKA